jgi:hypothetical protein
MVSILKVKYSFSLLLLALFLVTGIIVFDDYGVAWDERIQIYGIGEATWDFIMNGDRNTYLNNSEKYHGPAFELLLTCMQKLFSLDSIRQILIFRHFISFFFWWLSGICFFMLLKRYFRDPFIVFIGIAWFFLMPRIFADAFYNTKDIPFLGLISVSLLTMVRFLDKTSIRSAIVHGLACGFLIDIRIMGILIPLITFLLLILQNRFDLRKLVEKRILISLILFVASLIAFIIAFWPVLWIHPIEHFIAAWKEMKQFHWNGPVLYKGEFLFTRELPWHYTITWILISTPVLYLFCALVGLIGIFLVKRMNSLQFAAILLLAIPLMSITILNSVVYDVWRHTFFLYLSVCILGLSGLNLVLQKIPKKFYQQVFRITIIGLTAQIAVSMFSIHPYQNVYFNKVAYLVYDPRNDFELDYWGLSYREAIEKIVLNAGSEQVKVHFANTPGIDNLYILPDSITAKIEYMETPAGADYYITNFRWEPRRNIKMNNKDSIMAGGLIISGTYVY